MVTPPDDFWWPSPLGYRTCAGTGTAFDRFHRGHPSRDPRAGRSRNRSSPFQAAQRRTACTSWPHVRPSRTAALSSTRHQGENAAHCTPGVALIDEIDLHLHPDGRGRSLMIPGEPSLRFSSLRRLHSPFILQSLLAHAASIYPMQWRRRRQVKLNEPEAGPDFRRESIEDIAEQAMGVENYLVRQA